MQDPRLEGQDATGLPGGVRLEPGERVLWEGRPGFGIARFERRQILRGAVMTLLAIWALCALLCGVSGFAGRAGLAGILVLIAVSWVQTGILVLGVTVVVLLSRLIGGRPFSIATIALDGPLLALTWVDAGRRGGIAGLTRMLQEPGMWVFVAAVAVAVWRVLSAVLERRHTRYYLTTHRACEVRDRSLGAVVVWESPLPRARIEVRAVWPFGARRRGHIAIGSGIRRRLMRWLDQPDRVVEDIRRVMAEQRAASSDQALPPE